MRRHRRGRSLRRRYGRAHYDHSARAVAEVARATNFSGGHKAIIKAASGSVPKTLSAAHEKVLHRVGAGIFLGPWSNVLLYAPALRYWPSAEHRAMVQLVRRGDLRVLRATGDDLAPWADSARASEHGGHTRDFGYILVPATSSAAQGAQSE